MKAEDFDTAFYPGGHGPKSRISEGNYFAKSTATTVLRPAIWHYILQAYAYEIMAWSQMREMNCAGDREAIRP